MNPIRKVVARPMRIGFAAPTLCFLEVFLTIVVGAVTLSILWAIGALLLMHAASVLFTALEPDAETMLTEAFQTLFEALLSQPWPGQFRRLTRNTWDMTPHAYFNA